MTQKTLAELVKHLPATQSKLSNVAISSVTGHSRTVTKGTLFVAVVGGSFDGHRFIPAAIEQGAAAIIGTMARVDLALPDDFPYVQVADSRRALAICAAALHDFPSRAMTVIGITGTDGKTTTSTILESILVAATRTAAFPSGRVGVITTVGARICGDEIDTGFHVTTPDAPAVQAFLAQMLAAGCRYAIVESTSHGLAQDRVAAVDFDVACVTNITHEHIDWHGSRGAYIAAKALLFRMLFHGQSQQQKFAVLNLDDTQNYAGEGSYAPLLAVLDEEQRRAREGVGARKRESEREPVDVRIVQYRIGSGANVQAANVRALPDRTHFDLSWGGGSVPIETQMIGDFNVQNILCAASVALALNISPDALQQGVAALAGVVGRMERIDAGQSFLAIVDFAHSPASLERALLTLRQLVGRAEADGMEQGGREPKLIAIFGSAGLRDVAKRRLMGQVSGRLADFTIITAEDPRTEDLAAINQEIAAGVSEYATDDAFTIVPDRTEAIRFAVQMARPGDVVVAFGKGHERTMCFGETEFPWSDQETMRSALVDVKQT